MQETQAKAATKHTALPWRTDKHEDSNGIIIRATTEENGGKYEDIVAILEDPDILLSMESIPEDREAEAKANAVLIFQACNNFEKLLKAAKSALEFMERIEAEEWEEGEAETIPSVEAFRQALAEIEVTQ